MKIATAIAGAIVAVACGSAEPAPAPATRAETTPARAAIDGSELVGRELSEWQFSDWSGEPMTLRDLRGKVVVVRFWTTECPYCDKTMPALEALRRELEGKPVVFIGAFHDKPVGSHSDMKRALESVAIWKVGFPVAFDRGWKTLETWWLKTASRDATSVTFVIGKDGKVTFVHPGPVFHPSDDPAEAEQNRDYEAVRRAITAALAS